MYFKKVINKYLSTLTDSKSKKKYWCQKSSGHIFPMPKIPSAS